MAKAYRFSLRKTPRRCVSTSVPSTWFSAPSNLRAADERQLAVHRGTPVEHHYHQHEHHHQYYFTNTKASDPLLITYGGYRRNRQRMESGGVSSNHVIDFIDQADAGNDKAVYALAMQQQFNKAANDDGGVEAHNLIVRATPGRQSASVSIAGAGREKWSNKCEFLLAVIGFAVDLGNVWRFPYVCYRNGGGAFLIPYMVMFFFGGLPLFYMELILGQYHRSGCLTLWDKVCPLLKGIGFAICICVSYLAFFYNTIIAYAVFYFFSSFHNEVPWKTCDNAWNTKNCTLVSEVDSAFEMAFIDSSTLLPDANATMTLLRQIAGQERIHIRQQRGNHATLPAEEFFNNHVLGLQYSTGIDDLGGVKWSLTGCLFFVFFIVYFALWKGPKSSGKAVWITATMPYIVLFILLVRGVTLPGASKGLAYYLTPQWDMLFERSVWIEAATQIFFSLGPGFGVILALSSYNDFNNDCYMDAVVTSTVNSMTSFLSGFVIFSVLGYMAELLDKDVEDIARDIGPGLIFYVYPQALATMVGSSFWSLIFFFMLFTLGIDSTFGGLEALITAFCDQFPSTVGRRRELFVFSLILYCFIGGFITTTYGGQYIIEFLDQFGVTFSLLFIVLIETIAVCWCYGVERICDDVECMLGYRPSLWWRLSWRFFSPAFIIIIFIFAVYDLKPLTLGPYIYPDWAQYLGWLIRLSSMLMIPFYAVYHLTFCQTGSICDRIKKSLHVGVVLTKPPHHQPPQNDVNL